MRAVRHGFWDEEWGARVDSTPSPSAEDVFFAEPDPDPPMTVDELHDSLKLLTARQRFVIELRYGMRDGHEHTLREIADLMGLNFKTVEEYEVAAIKRLRRVKTPPQEGFLTDRSDL